MKIGNLDLGRKLLLAPMADVTDSAYRKIAKEFGAGLTFTQMVSAKGVIRNQFETLKRLSFHRSEKPVGVQILGKDPDLIRSAVKDIVTLKPDIIDINCGCSVEKVTKHGFGSDLLDKPQQLGAIIKNMVGASWGIPISAKIRLGRNKTKINVLEIAKVIEDNGASVIIVHGRTRADKYDTDAEWDWIAKVKESVSIPVVGNGSCFTPKDVMNMIEHTKCDSVMIARGAIGNPFIFSRFNELVETGTDPGQPNPEIVRDTAIKHLNLMIENFGEHVGLNKAKKHLIWYFMSFNGITPFIDLVMPQNDKDELVDMLFEHSEKIINEKYPEEDFNKINENFKEKVLFWMKDKIEDDVQLSKEELM